MNLLDLEAELDDELRWGELCLDLFMAGRVDRQWVADSGARATRLWRRLVDLDLLRARLALRFNADQLDSLVAALNAGARASELLALGVCGLNCAGEDLTVIAPEELRGRIEAALRLEQEGRPSRWLSGYAKLLAAESRRRRGA